ncbi:TetR/AcrR family transcriptional regulator [Actinomadura opuntiae]|uniref:TetR/AcrR family transcriptional regulator n=1 Tax=Actinomadura sp. OS1-43 TaxID=604315 RepID=UPI00255AE9BF|nr:TetR/AcrR family transcriptional regulator [Actinomadura sp. OS1-43]MDL4821935.1 helix-turn-helix domain-containing protein [Actinomadura sp. OS1-43]
MASGEVPTRVRLLEAAVAVMAESGWAAVTSRAVAERAEANNALVHYYFGSVDALRRAAVMHGIERELEGPVNAILQAPDVLDGVEQAVAVLTASGGGPGQRVMAEALVAGLRDAELREQSAVQLRMFRDLVAARLTADRDAGRLRPDADPAGLAVVIAALLDGLLLHALMDPATDAAGAAASVTALLRAAAPPAGPADHPQADRGDDGDAARQ